MFKKVNMPSNWEFISLKDVFKLSSGKTRPKNLKNYPEGAFIYPVYGGNGIIGYSNKYLIDSKTIAIGRVGAYCGSIHATDNKSWITDNTLYAKEFINEKVDFAYLNRVLRVLDLNKFKKEVGQPLISQSVVYSQYIPLPPLETQKKIVEILENAEKLKEWRQESDELSDEYLKSIFHEMFGDLGINDKCWEIDYLEKLVTNKITDGVHKTPKYIKSGIPFITAKDINKGFIDFSDCKFISENEHKSLIKRCNPEKNDLLLSKVGTLGLVAKIENDLDFSIFVQLALIKPNKNIINSVFLKYVLKSTYIQNQILNKSNKSTMSYIGIGKISKLKIPLPPITLQNQFAQIVQQIETLKTHQSQSKQEIDNLFNTLMQKAFKGELVC